MTYWTDFSGSLMQLPMSLLTLKNMTEARPELHWLDIPERIQFPIVVTAYRSLNGLTPVYLTELFVPVYTEMIKLLFAVVIFS